MDYVQLAFYDASNWHHDNSYSNLTATARGRILSMTIIYRVLT